MDTLTFKASDGSQVSFHSWLPTRLESPCAVVQIAHGMAEHSLRYSWFAEKLTDEGFAVYANDHRGHGKTAPNEESMGHFGDAKGWAAVVHDMKNLNDLIREKHRGIPVFLFGHSMGSFLSRDFIASHDHDLSGVILSATAGDPGISGRMGLLLAKSQAFLKSPQSPCPLLDRLTFKTFNKSFTPTRTLFDWLSRDPDQVDKYINDPCCGFMCSAQFYVDLISGIIKVNSLAHIRKTPASLPVYLFAGDKDPVGNDGKGVYETHAAFRKAGIRDLSMKIYDEGRHEMLNDINKEDVANDVITWIKSHLHPGS